MTLKRCFLSLLTSGLFLSSLSLAAQRDSDEELPKDFKSRLWYGGQLILGFSGGGGESIFQFGLSPQVGYKITEPLSIGPRMSAVFNSYKLSGFKAVSLFNVDIGPFVRYRIFRGLFAQGEFTYEWFQQPILVSNGTITTLEKQSDSRTNPRLGMGWNWGGGRGGGGSEFLVLYNFALADDIDSYLPPWEYRFGFTWNF